MFTAIRHERIFYANEEEGFVVQVRNDEDKRKYWMEVWVDKKYKDLGGDWNQYIFHLDDPEDVLRKEFQMNPDNFEEVFETAVDYLMGENLIDQDDDGYWYYTNDVNDEKE